MKAVRRFRDLVRRHFKTSSGLNRIQIVAMAMLAITVAMVGLASYLRSRPKKINLEKNEKECISSENKSEREITVHVAGAAVAPGVYTWKQGDRVQRAIETAGGPATNANLDGLNLARKVKDGEQILVPPRNQQYDIYQGVKGDKSTGSMKDTTVNVNLADEDELEKLPGIGPVLATRIIEYRKKNGPFSSIEDLLKVPGIGEKKLQDLKVLITLG